MSKRRKLQALSLVLTFVACANVLAQSPSSSTVRLLTGLDSLSLRRAAVVQRLRTQMAPSLANAGVSLGGPSIILRTNRSKPWPSPPPGTNKYDDRLAQELRRHDLDLGNTVDFGAVLRQALRSRKATGRSHPRRAAELPLPTEKEVAILQILWGRGTATSLDLYGSLDSTLLVQTTAERFWAELHRMAMRGFVTETLISPQQRLTIGVGPLAFSVEMSGKNRRNRIYRYEPLVDRETLLTLLESRQWLASARGNTAKAGLISRLLWRVRQGATE